MNKALHCLVYLFLACAGAGLYFEVQLNQKRAMLTDRNRLQEDYLVRMAKTIEKAEPEKGAPMELKVDSDPVEAKIIDVPSTENALEDYNSYLEQSNLETYNWDGKRQQLRNIYVLDAEGKPVMDGDRPMQTGPGTEDELLSALFESCKAQQSRLNSTRAELGSLRGKLEQYVDELNKLKPIARQDKVTIEEKNEAITKLEDEKLALEDQITKLKGQCEELNTEIASVKDELVTARNETEEVREELEKKDKIIERLNKILRDSVQTRGSKSTESGTAVASLPSGDKGSIIEADNESMFAVVKFTNAALLELKGGNADAVLPAIELGVRRANFNGPAGEFVGRIKIRQEIKGKPFVICDILGNWEQDKLAVGDIIFAD